MKYFCDIEKSPTTLDAIDILDIPNLVRDPNPRFIIMGNLNSRICSI